MRRPRRYKNRYKMRLVHKMCMRRCYTPTHSGPLTKLKIFKKEKGVLLEILCFHLKTYFVFFLFVVKLMVVFSWRTWEIFLSFEFGGACLPNLHPSRDFLPFDPQGLGHHKAQWNHFEYSSLIICSIFILYEFSKPAWLSKASLVLSHYFPRKVLSPTAPSSFLFLFFPFLSGAILNLSTNYGPDVCLLSLLFWSLCP